MTVLRSTIVTLLALALLLAVPTAASAKFSAAASAGVSASTDTLVPPTGVSATCNRGLGLRVRWTATTDQYASGYTITTTFSGVSTQQSVSGATTTGYNYGSVVPDRTTIQLVSVFKSWTSVKTPAITVNC